MEFAKCAVELDERDAVCRFVLGRAKCMTQHYAAAIAELEAAIELNPSFAHGYFALAFTLVWCGREDEAIALIEQAVELSPRDPHLWTFYNARALAHFSLGELTSAAFFARRPSSIVLERVSPAPASRPEPGRRRRSRVLRTCGVRLQRPRIRSKPTHAIESISLR
jgi:tetratricopeptide (TPR) repeat protein